MQNVGTAEIVPSSVHPTATFDTAVYASPFYDQARVISTSRTRNAGGHDVPTLYHIAMSVQCGCNIANFNRIDMLKQIPMKLGVAT
ncbi:hypothetical protein DYQ86_07250 [Acidobacteria bacterium AB60]|nr:hypothetical protein DYQ86_07250 [Acidobacteria bacterium AB60]